MANQELLFLEQLLYPQMISKCNHLAEKCDQNVINFSSVFTYETSSYLSPLHQISLVLPQSHWSLPLWGPCFQSTGLSPWLGTHCYCSLWSLDEGSMFEESLWSRGEGRDLGQLAAAERALCGCHFPWSAHVQALWKVTLIPARHAGKATHLLSYQVLREQFIKSQKQSRICSQARFIFK